MMRLLRRQAKNVLNVVPRYLNRREFRNQRLVRFNERPVELAFVFRKIGETYPRSILDVGTGGSSLPHLMRTAGPVVTAIDNIRDYWPSGMSNRHYHVLDDDITNPRLAGPFDLITCVSVLEHIEAADDAVKNMFRLLAPDGSLLLTFPYTELGYVRNVYKLTGSSYGQRNPFITQSFSRADLDRWLLANAGEVVEQEFWQFWTGDHWTVGEQVLPPRKASVDEKHQLTCLHLRSRTGPGS